MIKFFRHIRQRLLKENNFSRYLVYALGEIFLVVIGILIALQINNWNEQKNKRYQEKAILNEIISDLEESEAAILSRLKVDTSGVVGSIDSNKLVYKHMKMKLAYHDSLDIHFTRLFTYFNVVYKLSGYETLKSYGFDYIQDPELRKQIGIYYTTVVPQTFQQYKQVEDDFYNYMIDFLRKDFETVFTGEINGYRSYYIPINYNELVMNNEFLQSINVYRDIKEQYLGNLMKSLEETRKLHNQISEYTKI